MKNIHYDNSFSDDLMVFKKIKAPINKDEFLEFYKEQVK